MSTNLIWAFVAGIVAVIGWPIIKAILIFLLTLVTGLFGALTTAVNTLPAAPLNVSSPPAVSAPAVSGGEQLILSQMKQDKTEQRQTDSKQDKRIEEVATNVKDIADKLAAPATPAPANPPPCSGCGRGEYLELPPAR